MSTQEQNIDELYVKVGKLEETATSSGSKGALVEKMTFAGIPIMFSCIVYLMSALSSANHELTILQSKINVVVNAENKAIPPQGTTIEMERIKEEAALARAAMTLERTKDMLAMKEEAALSRARIASESAAARAELDKRVAILEWRMNKAGK
jgi:predicted peptidase